MTLVSHRYKFIYMKTKKTAGSSIWAFMKPYCLSPEDQANTSVQTKDKAISAAASPYGIVSRTTEGSAIVPQPNPLKRLLRIPCRWDPHKKAKYIKKDLGKKTFHQYFKFCSVRNPWDRAISQWHWKQKQAQSDLSLTPALLEAFILKHLSPGFGLSEIYTINHTSICDFYIRYEHLKRDLLMALKTLDITVYNINALPSLKGGVRTSSREYQQYYTPKTKALIEKLYRSEIDQFEYEFQPNLQ